MRERRQMERYECRTSATCHPAPEGEPLGAVEVCDVSVGGVALRTGKPVEPETLLYLDLAGEGSEPGHRLLVQVIHAREEAEGTWLLGCALSTTLTQVELQALLRAARAGLACGSGSPS